MQKEKELEVGVAQVLKILKYKNVKPIYKIDENGNIYSEYKKDYLKPKKDKDGYLEISLAGKNKTIFVRIATLVAYNFIGNPPVNMEDPTIDHIDNNRLNNYYKNLRWIERSKNSSIRKNKGIGELNHESKLTENQVFRICELLMENKLTLKEIADLFNVSKYTINNIKMKKNWIYITNKYNFPNSIVKRNKKGKFYKFGSTGK